MFLQKTEEKTPEKYACEICDYKGNNKYCYLKHLQTKKHNGNKHGKNDNKNDNKSAENPPQKYVCEICHYKTNKKTNYNKHLQTKKHNDNNDNKSAENPPKMYACEKCKFNSNHHSHYLEHLQTKKHLTIHAAKQSTDKKYMCECGNVYAYQSGLSRHKKTCSYEVETTKNSIEQHAIVKQDTNELVSVIKTLVEQNTILIQENKDHKNKMIDLASQTKINGNNNNNTNNSNNNTFNLNTFLNVTCKDAENIEDVISKINYDIRKLLVRNVSEFIQYLCNPLTSKPQHLRPIHCTDTKRNKVVVKKENKWQKNIDMSPIIDELREKMYEGILSIKQDDWMDNDKLQDKRNNALKYSANMYKNQQQYEKINHYICKHSTIHKPSGNDTVE